eukprot:16013-Heterococcus_DN1.PRE.2
MTVVVNTVSCVYGNMLWYSTTAAAVVYYLYICVQSTAQTSNSCGFTVWVHRARLTFTPCSQLRSLTVKSMNNQVQKQLH